MDDYTKAFLVFIGILIISMVVCFTVGKRLGYRECEGKQLKPQSTSLTIMEDKGISYSFYITAPNADTLAYVINKIQKGSRR